MVTIHDVAKKAGVSITTVSWVINEKGNISDETRQKVWKAIDELNYVPSFSAQYLKKKKTETIGLILSELAGYFYSELIRGIEDTLIKYDEYSMLACSANKRTINTAIDFFTRKRYDGYILYSPLIKDEIIKRTAHRQLPVVVLDRLISDKYIFNILINNRSGIQEALEHISKKGYKKLGIVKGRDSFDSNERFDAIVEFKEKYGFVIKDEWITESKFTKISGYELGNYYYNLSDKPEVIFCLNDESAIGLMQKLREYGVVVPRDIGIVGFDDIEISRYLNPSLSTVKRPMYDIGTLAVEMLFECFNGKNYEQTIRLDTSFVERESI